MFIITFLHFKTTFLYAQANLFDFNNCIYCDLFSLVLILNNDQNKA